MDDRANTGRSEEVLGKAIQGKRDDVVITSKVFSQIGPGPNDSGLSRFHIMREVERSLSRLNTNHIDVYLIHAPDETTPQEETIRAMDDLVRSGKVRYIGCCNHQHGRRARHSGSPIGLTQRPICVFRTCITC